MKLLKEKVVYKRYRTIVERTFLDGNGKKVICEVRGGEGTGVSIVGITKNHKIILLKEFKPGHNKFLIDIPGGTTEKEEDPINCAERELLEETGYKGENAKIIGRYYMDSYSKNLNYVILIEDCKYLRQDEEIEVILKPYKDFLLNINTEETVNSVALFLAREYLTREQNG